jgi:hypothetical protein
MRVENFCPAEYWEPGLGPCICGGRVHSAPDERSFKGPARTYRLRWWRHDLGCNDWKVSRYGWTRWEASDGCLGSSGRTPWTALLHLWRWRREHRDEWETKQP